MKTRLLDAVATIANAPFFLFFWLLGPELDGPR